MIRKYQLAFAAATAMVLSSASAHATTRTANLHWESYAYGDSCLGLHLARPGGAYFWVNDIGIPTYETSVQYYQQNNQGYVGTGIYDAPFNTSLFRPGGNLIHLQFGLETESACYHEDELVWLKGLHDTPPVLFQASVVGTVYSGTTNVDLSLEEIDPQLAADIAKFKGEIDEWIHTLDTEGPHADQAVAEKERLEQLKGALDAMMEAGFDQLSLEALQALLEEYADLVPHLYAELEQVIHDLQRDIGALRTEMQRITDELRLWTTALPGATDGTSPFSDHDFEAGDSSLPPVTVPDVLGDDEFDASHDPYDHYADDIIAGLSTTLDTSAHVVVQRAQFLDILAGWRTVTSQVRDALQARTVVGQAEWAAFLNSLEKVQRYAHDYVSDTGWMRDNGMDPSIPELVDTALYRVDTIRSQRLKAAINLLPRLDDEGAAAVFGFVYTLRELSVSYEQARAQRLKAELLAKRDTYWDTAIGFLGKVASVGWQVAVATTPIGDFIDACEAITGREGCNLISGRELSWSERAFAGVGMFMWGSSHAMRQLGNRLDLIKCRPHFTGFAAAAASLPCTIGRFFNKLDDAVENVGKRYPQRDLDDIIEHGDGSLTFVRSLDGQRVFFDKRGFPKFALEQLWPFASQAQVWIEFSCKRGTDFSRADAAAGWTPSTKPQQAKDHYTWHHTEKFERHNGKVMILMQLVETEIHDWARHTGGIAIGKQILPPGVCD